MWIIKTGSLSSWRVEWWNCSWWPQIENITLSRQSKKHYCDYVHQHGDDNDNDWLPGQSSIHRQKLVSLFSVLCRQLVVKLSSEIFVNKTTVSIWIGCTFFSFSGELIRWRREAHIVVTPTRPFRNNFLLHFPFVLALSFSTQSRCRCRLVTICVYGIIVSCCRCDTITRWLERKAAEAHQNNDYDETVMVIGRVTDWLWDCVWWWW